MEPRCIVVLSSKSAGSSLLHRTLASAATASAISSSEHEENETLFWIKGAAALAMPQEAMVRSVVPMPVPEARTSLHRFLAEHGIDVPAAFPASADDLYSAWADLRGRHVPLMVEKSPHHLRQPSALRLLAGLPEADPGAQYLFVGLVRHPLEVCYSAWRRFGYPPEAYEREWLATYANLLWAQQLLGDKLVTIRYEDLVTDPSVLAPVGEFLGLGGGAFDTGEVHPGSLGRWREDPGFGFAPRDETRALARVFGYDDESLVNPRAGGTWLLRRTWRDVRRRIRRARAERGRG